MKGLLLLSLLVALACGTRVRYDNQHVLRFQARNFTELESLRNFAEIHRLDVWAQHPGQDHGVFAEIDIRMPKTLSVPRGYVSTPFIEDLQGLIDREAQSISVEADDFFTKYRTYKEHETFLQGLVNQYPDLATLVSIGKTVEGRSIWGLVITSKKQTNKPGIFLNGGQHAREWISPSTVAYIAYSLLSGYKSNATVTKLVDSIEWTIVPIVNGDGYEFTFTGDRLWRKNRRVNKNSSCLGVDTNRNWGFKWNTGGSSSDPCNEAYHGPSAFSEPENTAVANYVTKNSNIQAYIDFHSYSQLWMTPWGYTSTLPKDDKLQKQCGQQCANALKAVNGIVFQVGNVANIIYVASGGSLDWTYGVQNVVLSFAVELRDTGRYGFVLPVNQIVPSGSETFASVVALANCVLG
jgi:murein tripeptide amidase MpaA